MKAFGIELPVLQTLWRQLALAGFGGILLGIGILTPLDPPLSPDSTPTPTFTPAPIPTVDDFAGRWFNWNDNHELGDVSVLDITRVDDKNASFEVGVFTLWVQRPCPKPTMPGYWRASWSARPSSWARSAG